MAKYSIESIRNIAFCGHGGSGKTTLADTILNDLGFDVLNYSGSWIDWSTAATIANGNPNELVLSLTEEWTDNEAVIE